MTTITKVKEHPIIFTTELISKILDGTKTQTRRVIKRILPELDELRQFWGSLADKTDDELRQIRNDVWVSKCPYGQVGDRLWVRETYKARKYGGLWTFGDEAEVYVEYKADEQWAYIPVFGEDKKTFKEKFNWCSGRFMYRWASRITLEITGIRVERLQHMSDYEAQCEGVHTGVLGFAELWNSLNTKRGYSWEFNPWVWVIEFVMAQKDCSEK